jgi:hypothetical protein
MSTITVILEPHIDGTLHLPLPAGSPHGKFRVVASLEPLAAPDNTATWNPPRPRRLGVRALTAEDLRDIARAEEDERGLRTDA